MIEKFLLMLILIFQAIFSGLILLGKENSFNWNIFISFLNLLVVVGGLFWGYYKLKKEILFNKKLEIHEKITNMLIGGLNKSFYDLSYSIANPLALKESNPRDKDDFYTKSLKTCSKELIQKIANLQSNFQKFYEFFQFWKALFSEKVDRELKFLFDLETIFGKDLWQYQRKLSEYSMLSLMKDVADIEKERGELLLLEEKISKKNTVLSNGLYKFVSDMSREVFSGLFVKRESIEKRLFDLEIENLNNGDLGIFLTDKGFKYQFYKKTAFQEEFGGFKEREKKLRTFLEK